MVGWVIYSIFGETRATFFLPKYWLLPTRNLASHQSDQIPQFPLPGQELPTWLLRFMSLIDFRAHPTRGAAEQTKGGGVGPLYTLTHRRPLILYTDGFEYPTYTAVDLVFVHTIGTA